MATFKEQNEVVGHFGAEPINSALTRIAAIQRSTSELGIIAAFAIVMMSKGSPAGTRAGARLAVAVNAEARARGILPQGASVRRGH